MKRRRPTKREISSSESEETAVGSSGKEKRAFPWVPLPTSLVNETGRDETLPLHEPRMSNGPLERDHEKRPIWVTEDGQVFLEVFEFFLLLTPGFFSVLR